MNYEEKAKRYDEALERARDLMTKQNPPAFNKDLISLVFPELAESEDEKIRKAIISILKGEIRYISIEDTNKYVAWLEKQAEKSAEPEWCHHKVDLSNCSEEYRKAYYDGWNNCNMQHSQCEAKSNDDDEKIRKALKQGFFEYGKSFTKFGGIKVGDIIAWLEKQREKPQGKSALESIKEERVDNQNCVKSADKIEPKFKVGDWIANGGANPCYVKSIFGDYYELCSCEGVEYTKHIIDVNYIYHLWTLQDAKEGDVLVTDFGEDDLIVMYKSRCTIDTINVHCCLGNEFTCSNIGLFNAEDVKPATKEQRDLLFEKMKQAGYEWDTEKKELKGIEEEVNGEDYGIDSLYHAQIILEKTLGKVDGYQSDDGILDHKSAITAIKKLYKQISE